MPADQKSLPPKEIRNGENGEDDGHAAFVRVRLARGSSRGLPCACCAGQCAGGRLSDPPAAHLSSAIRPAVRPTSSRGCSAIGSAKRLGQQFIIENRPGAGNNLAHRVCRQGGAGRLHDDAGQPGQRHQRLALQASQFQFPARHRSGRRLHPRAERDGSESVGAGKDRRRIHRLCESQSRQGQHGLVRQRHVDPSLR